MGIRLTALAPAELAALLAKAGGKGLTAQDVEDDIAAGAPRNSDGSVNLVAYTAWLVRGDVSGD